MEQKIFRFCFKRDEIEGIIKDNEIYVHDSREEAENILKERKK